MSQQINLLNYALLPKRDWLSLPAVLAVAALIVLVESGLFFRAKVAVTGLEAQQQALENEAKTLQDQVVALSTQVGQIRLDPALQKNIDARNEELAVGDDLMRALRSMSASETGFSAQLSGFAHQTMNGLWLTDFSVTQEGLSIKGRMLDSNLLPGYIKRLNSEPAFQGRKFAALEMKIVEPPKPETPGNARNTKASQATKVEPVYTEFSLLGVLPKDGASAGLSPKPQAPGDSVTTVDTMLQARKKTP